jgi:hypothetical protein
MRPYDVARLSSDCVSISCMEHIDVSSNVGGCLRAMLGLMQLR